MTARAAALVAGPVMRKTSAAPGERPLAMRTAATGIEAVAQTYTGMPRAVIMSIARMPFAMSFSAKKLSGTNAEIRAARASPMSIAFAMSRGRVMKP